MRPIVKASARALKIRGGQPFFGLLLRPSASAWLDVAGPGDRVELLARAVADRARACRGPARGRPGRCSASRRAELLRQRLGRARLEAGGEVHRREQGVGGVDAPQRHRDAADVALADVLRPAPRRSSRTPSACRRRRGRSPEVGQGALAHALHGQLRGPCPCPRRLVDHGRGVAERQLLPWCGQRRHRPARPPSRTRWARPSRSGDETRRRGAARRSRSRPRAGVRAAAGQHQGGRRRQDGQGQGGTTHTRGGEHPRILHVRA